MFARVATSAVRRTVLQQQIRKFSSEEGVVKTFNPQKGFGFITKDVVPEGANTDVFAHFSNIKSDGFKTLYPGQRVRFEVQAAERGETAVNIEALTPPPPRAPRRDQSY